MPEFPFLFGGTFIEAQQAAEKGGGTVHLFPFLFGGTFIEAGRLVTVTHKGETHFPSFSEGLSLRLNGPCPCRCISSISLPFRRDFH